MVGPTVNVREEYAFMVLSKYLIIFLFSYVPNLSIKIASLILLFHICTLPYITIYSLHITYIICTHNCSSIKHYPLINKHPFLLYKFVLKMGWATGEAGWPKPIHKKGRVTSHPIFTLGKKISTLSWVQFFHV